MKQYHALPVLIMLGMTATICGYSAQAQTPTTPTPPTTSPLPKNQPAKTITEGDAIKIALKRVPGQLENTGLTNDSEPYQVLVFSKDGKECEVFVDRHSGVVKKVNIPRLTRKKAVAAALRKVKGTVQISASHYDAVERVHDIVIVQSEGVVANVAVNDQTGKVIRVVRDSGGRG